MTEKLYTTGEFAKLCGVKKQTLFHYDSIGLLTPAYVTENGYRHYAYDQYQTFLLISCLKEAGMSLEDIKSYLYDANDAEKAEIVKERIDLLDARIAYLGRVRSILATTFSGEKAREGELVDNTITLQRLEQRDMFASKRLDTLDDQQLVEAVAELVKAVEPRIVCLSADSVLAGNLDEQRYLLIDPEDVDEKTAARLGLTPFTLPAGVYARGLVEAGQSPEDLYRRILADSSLMHTKPGEYFYEEQPSPEDANTGVQLAISVQLIQEDEDEEGQPQ